MTCAACRDSNEPHPELVLSAREGAGHWFARSLAGLAGFNVQVRTRTGETFEGTLLEVNPGGWLSLRAWLATDSGRPTGQGRTFFIRHLARVEVT